MDIYKYLIEHLLVWTSNLLEDLFIEGSRPHVSLGPEPVQDVMQLYETLQATVNDDGNHLT